MTKSEEYLFGIRKRIPVEYAHITANKTEYRRKNDVYFQIEYKPIDEKEVYIGFGSGYLDLVQKWLETEFELVSTDKEAKKNDNV